MKKVLVLLLGLALLLGTLASASAEMTWNLEGSIFPLAQKEKFTILTCGYRNGDVREIEKNPAWRQLLDAANLEIEFVYVGDYDAAESRDNLQMRLLGGDYGEAIWGFYVDTLSVADIADLGDADMLIPLEPFMNDPAVMPNLYKNVVSTHPGYIANIKSQDGHAYYLAGILETAAYTASEAQMMVNSLWLKAWKEARKVDHSPETLAEFEDMLVFFRDADLNGNGAKDEIPYFVAQNGFGGCCTLEHALGMYGIATKDSAADMNIMIGDDGKVFYAHTTEAYKEGLKQFAKWYADGLVWQDAIIGNAETITNLMAQGANQIGVYNACEDVVGFEPLMPPAVDGYTARYHRHPSIRTSVRQPDFVITNKCHNPQVLASFLDLLFDFDNFIRYTYGDTAMEHGAIALDDKGVYDLNTGVAYPEGFEWTAENKALASSLQAFELFTTDLFNSRVNADTYFGTSARVAGAKMYMEADIWNPINNLWPRCSLLAEDQENYSFLYTDVSTAVSEFRAKCLTGEWNVDEKWDDFQNQLKKLGINDMTEMIQRCYDAYVSR